jgi:hypothetical protein
VLFADYLRLANQTEPPTPSPLARLDIFSYEGLFAWTQQWVNCLSVGMPELIVQQDFALQCVATTGLFSNLTRLIEIKRD